MDRNGRNLSSVPRHTRHTPGDQGHDSNEEEIGMMRDPKATIAVGIERDCLGEYCDFFYTSRPATMQLVCRVERSDFATQPGDFEVSPAPTTADFTGTPEAHRKRPASSPVENARTTASKTRNDQSTTAVLGKITSLRRAPGSRKEGGATTLGASSRRAGASRLTTLAIAGSGRAEDRGVGGGSGREGGLIGASIVSGQASPRGRVDVRSRAGGSGRRERGSVWITGNPVSTVAAGSGSGLLSQRTTTGSIRLPDDEGGGVEGASTCAVPAESE